MLRESDAITLHDVHAEPVSAPGKIHVDLPDLCGSSAARRRQLVV